MSVGRDILIFSALTCHRLQLVSSMIDWVRIDELRNDFGEDDFLEIVAMFLSEVQERLDEMCETGVTVTAEDYHFLKGSAANLGFQAFRAACSVAEKNPTAADIVAIRQVFVRSRETFSARTDGASQVA